MIDPFEITDYNRDERGLQEFALFAIAVAGKKATTTAAYLDRFLSTEPNRDPFDVVKLTNRWYDLVDILRSSGFGQYNKLAKGFTEIAESDLDLGTCDVTDLEKIHGVGKKTSRFFVLHTREDARCAVIDTHIRKYLSETGYDVKEKSRYSDLESAFLLRSDRLELHPAVLDLEVWRHYAGAGARVDIWPVIRGVKRSNDGQEKAA